MSQAETVTLELLKGDSVTGTIVEELSNNQEKVLDHPQLGRLTILTSSLKSKQTALAWRTSMTAGLIGNEKTETRHCRQQSVWKENTKKVEIIFY